MRRWKQSEPKLQIDPKLPLRLRLRRRGEFSELSDCLGTKMGTISAVESVTGDSRIASG